MQSRNILVKGILNCKHIKFTALQERLNTEKQKRQQAEASSQEKERQNSMLSVDYRQLQQQLHKLEGEYRQECEKVNTFFFPLFLLRLSVYSIIFTVI